MTTPPTSPTLTVASRCHVGLVRTGNEDTFLVDAERCRYAVIDGMGGHLAGEVAAEMTRETLAEPLPLFEAVVEANLRVRTRGRSDYAVGGMGCVLTAVQLEGETLHVVHAGDTRAYLAGVDGPRQLTNDHTMMAVRREFQGHDRHEDEDGFESDHKVTRNIGAMDDDTGEWVERVDATFGPGDVLLLCSDGLHDVVKRREIVARLVRARDNKEDVEVVAQALLDLALERGGPDNITILVVRREGEPVPGPTPGPSPSPTPVPMPDPVPWPPPPPDPLPTPVGPWLGRAVMLGVGLVVGLALGWTLRRPPAPVVAACEPTVCPEPLPVAPVPICPPAAPPVTNQVNPPSTAGQASAATSRPTSAPTRPQPAPKSSTVSPPAQAPAAAAPTTTETPVVPPATKEPPAAAPTTTEPPAPPPAAPAATAPAAVAPAATSAPAPDSPVEENPPRRKGKK